MDKFYAVYELVEKWDKARKPLKAVLGDFFKDRDFSYLEKEFIKKHAYYKIKHFIYLRFFEEYADKKRIFPPGIKGIIRDIFVLFVHEESRTDADDLINTHLPDLKEIHNELFIKVKFHFKRFEEDIIKRSPLKKQLYVLNSYAREIVDLWMEQFSDKYVSTLMKSFNSAPQFSLRVNFQKNSRTELREKLEKSGIFTVPSDISKKILLLRNPEQVNFPENKELKNGDFIIQDEGEVILNQLHYAAPKELILDLNPASSQFFISYALDAHPRSHLHAICSSNHEIHSIINRIKPLSLARLEIKKINSPKDLYREYQNKADVVFARPSSNGFGKIKSEPDRKWNISRRYLSKLYEQQLKSLFTASKLVKSGGKIIYISDSFNKMENEKIVSKFLVKNPTYRIVGGHVLQPIFLKKCITPENYIRFHPNEVPFSSYFAAVLQKGS